MTFDWPTIQSVAISLSAVAGVSTFIYSYIWQRDRIKKREIADWQKTVVAEIFQTFEGEAMSFGEVLRRYQSEVPSYERYDIKKDDLSKQALRRIIVELIQAGVLEQYSRDSFSLRMPGAWLQRDEERLKRMNEASMETMRRLHDYVEEKKSAAPSNKDFDSVEFSESLYTKLDQDNARKEKIQAFIVNEVFENSAKHSVDSLAAKLVEKFEIDFDIAKSRIRGAVSNDKIAESDSGKLTRPIKTIEVG